MNYALFLISIIVTLSILGSMLILFKPSDPTVEIQSVATGKFMGKDFKAYLDYGDINIAKFVLNRDGTLKPLNSEVTLTFHPIGKSKSYGYLENDQGQVVYVYDQSLNQNVFYSIDKQDMQKYGQQAVAVRLRCVSNCAPSK